MIKKIQRSHSNEETVKKKDRKIDNTNNKNNKLTKSVISNNGKRQFTIMVKNEEDIQTTQNDVSKNKGLKKIKQKNTLVDKAKEKAALKLNPPIDDINTIWYEDEAVIENIETHEEWVVIIKRTYYNYKPKTDSTTSKRFDYTRNEDTTDFDPVNGIISDESPLGRALLGKKKGGLVIYYMNGKKISIKVKKVIKKETEEKQNQNEQKILTTDLQNKKKFVKNKEGITKNKDFSFINDRDFPGKAKRREKWEKKQKMKLLKGR